MPRIAIGSSSLGHGRASLISRSLPRATPVIPLRPSNPARVRSDLALCGTVPVKAELAPLTGNDMMPACEAVNAFATTGRRNLTNDMIFHAGYCIGLMNGVLLFSQVMALAAGNKPCLPEGTTSAQLISSVVNYLRAHPEDRNLESPVVAIKAVNVTWHCGFGIRAR